MESKCVSLLPLSSSINCCLLLHRLMSHTKSTAHHDYQYSENDGTDHEKTVDGVSAEKGRISLKYHK